MQLCWLHKSSVLYTVHISSVYFIVVSFRTTAYIAWHFYLLFDFGTLKGCFSFTKGTQEFRLFDWVAANQRFSKNNILVKF